ncbi:MAG TPA: 30S ribosomal protein S7 [Candidatus Nanoarchaeia archaeon]|nr:30S ribosomal protein S7 [Candidatus Nanoarchaeia archaeon]
MTELLLFNTWSTKDISVQDPGLKSCINIEQVLTPKSHGREAKFRFGKNKYHLVERLIGKLQIPGHKGKKHKYTSGHMTGKGTHATSIVLKAFKIVEQKTKENPVKVFVKAVENAAPREEITTIEYGGARYPQAVDCAPQRRIDFALRQMTQGAYGKSFNSRTTIEQALADEIIKAYTLDSGSHAIARKLEVERQADSSR